MKVTKEQAEQNRAALLEAASRLYRKHGFDGVGVAQIAREAGLTHGSLYGHFESKDHYAAEACAHAFADRLQLLQQAEPGDNRALAAVFSRYISEQHRDEPERGCPISALGADAARKKGPVAETMTRGIETYLSLLTEHLAFGEQDTAESHGRAIAMLSMMVGGMILSRASVTANEDLSKQVLDVVLSKLEEQIA
jgi:TetR/AcrR family transcriptional regulator, transcriptional repressor for nem operon